MANTVVIYDPDKTGENEEINSKKWVDPEEIIGLFVLVLKETYNKFLFTEPSVRKDLDGLSLLGCVNATKREFNSIKKEIEKDFGIFCIAQNSSYGEKCTDFFVITNEVAEYLYWVHNGNFSSIVLLDLLSDKVLVERVKKELETIDFQKKKNSKNSNKQRQKIKQKMAKTNAKNALTLEVNKLLKDFPNCKVKGGKPLPEGEMYLQVHTVGLKRTNIAVSKGTETEKKMIIDLLKHFFKGQCGDNFGYEKGRKGTTLTVSIEGFENQNFVEKPKKTKKEKVVKVKKVKPAKVAKAKTTKVTLKAEHETEKNILVKFVRSLSKEQQDYFITQLDLDLLTDKSAVVKEISKDFYFVPKSASVRKSFNPAIFVDPEKVAEMVNRKKKK
ncbi:MAG: hypothetical protein NT068_03770 [Candidatus Nomurabacteria bacterium]|nr:hypothetical protein [Candidatus Nomurabacteria bacterium]